MAISRAPKCRAASDSRAKISCNRDFLALAWNHRFTRRPPFDSRAALQPGGELSMRRLRQIVLVWTVIVSMSFDTATACWRSRNNCCQAVYYCQPVDCTQPCCSTSPAPTPPPSPPSPPTTSVMPPSSPDNGGTSPSITEKPVIGPMTPVPPAAGAPKPPITEPGPAVAPPATEPANVPKPPKAPVTEPAPATEPAPTAVKEPAPPAAKVPADESAKPCAEAECGRDGGSVRRAAPAQPKSPAKGARERTSQAGPEAKS